MIQTWKWARYTLLFSMNFTYSDISFQNSIKVVVNGTCYDIVLKHIKIIRSMMKITSQ